MLIVIDYCINVKIILYYYTVLDSFKLAFFKYIKNNCHNNKIIVNIISIVIRVRMRRTFAYFFGTSSAIPLQALIRFNNTYEFTKLIFI